MSIEAMKQALEVIEAAIKAGDWKVDGACDPDMAIHSLRTAIEQAEKQEPVAWGNLANWCLDSDRVLITDKTEAEKYHRDVYDLTPLYTHPPKREWVGLTDEEMHACWDSPLTPLGMKHARMIEAKLKEKNT